MMSRKLAAMARMATRTWPGSNGAPALGTGSSRRFSNVPALETQPPRPIARRHQEAVDGAAGVDPSGVNLPTAHQHLRFTGRQRRGTAASSRGPSISASTTRPGCSVCAERISPHTAAPARSVTSSPANAIAPRVATTKHPGVMLGQPGLHRSQSLMCALVGRRHRIPVQPQRIRTPRTTAPLGGRSCSRR